MFTSLSHGININSGFSINWQASDVLAVELLQKDARLSLSGELGKPCRGGK